jgi:hypothetical protein
MSDTEDKGSGSPIPLQWREDDIPTSYANQIVITHASGEFYLVFGELILPINFLLNPGVETAPELLQVRPVAKIVVTPEVMLQIAETIQGNVEKYKQRLGLTESTE